MKRFRKTTAGFTLLELLIVIIVIGVLATLAMPRFGRYFAKARSAEALSTIDAILTAQWIYFQENNAFAPDSTKLLVTYPETNFTYAFAAKEGTLTVTATGAGAAVDIEVAGTINSTGARTITTSKLP